MEEDLATDQADSRLVDMTAHFRPRRQYRGAESWTWHMRQEGRQVTGRDDYIISSDMYNFYNAGIREARTHTYHWMVLAVILGEGALRNCRYIVSRTQ